MQKMKTKNENDIKELEQTIKDIDRSIEAKQKEDNGNNNFFRFFKRYQNMSKK
jgi:hypothetical protein